MPTWLLVLIIVSAWTAQRPPPGAQSHRRPRALSRGLRSAREVDDQQDEQDDDEDPDQSIARSGECEQHGCLPSVVYGGDSDLTPIEA
jgi:hypothetical protein